MLLQEYRFDICISINAIKFPKATSEKYEFKQKAVQNGQPFYSKLKFNINTLGFE